MQAVLVIPPRRRTPRGSVAGLGADRDVLQVRVVDDSPRGRIVWLNVGVCAPSASAIGITSRRSTSAWNVPGGAARCSSTAVFPVFDQQGGERLGVGRVAGLDPLVLGIPSSVNRELL